MGVHAVSLENFKVEIDSGAHRFISDEPAGAGGNDAGPDPYALLLGGLAACKIITVQLYARRKGWPLTRVEASLSIHKEYARDCEECVSEGNAKIDIIDCELLFHGDLSAEQKARLKEISERCPVHRTLTTETVIRTRMKE